MTGESWSEAIARPLLFGFDSNAILVAGFYVSFILLTQLVLTNVVVAVLLDNFVTDPGANEADDAHSGGKISVRSSFLDTVEMEGASRKEAVTEASAICVEDLESEEFATSVLSVSPTPPTYSASSTHFPGVKANRANGDSSGLDARLELLEATVQGVQGSMELLHRQLDMLLPHVSPPPSAPSPQRTTCSPPFTVGVSPPRVSPKSSA